MPNVATTCESYSTFWIGIIMTVKQQMEANIVANRQLDFHARSSETYRICDQAERMGWIMDTWNERQWNESKVHKYMRKSACNISSRKTVNIQLRSRNLMLELIHLLIIMYNMFVHFRLYKHCKVVEWEARSTAGSMRVWKCLARALLGSPYNDSCCWWWYFDEGYIVKLFPFVCSLTEIDCGSVLNDV